MRTNKSGTIASGWWKWQNRLVFMSGPRRLYVESRERHMEALLENVSGSVELLAAAAHTATVNQWDQHTLSRAFHWARYCEHIHSRFHSNTAIRRVLEKQLQLTNQSLRDVIPEFSEVSFSDLSRYQQLLLIGLLNNPELPCSIMKLLFETKNPVSVAHSECEDATGLCSDLIQYKSACKVLRPLSRLSPVGADAEVQGEMLIERLGTLLSQGSDLHQAEHLLYSILLVFEGAVQHFCRVIAAALLTAKDSAQETASQDFLLDWLQNQHSVLQHMCSGFPPALIKDLAKEHQKFRDAFCSTLKTWASEMEYSINDDEWIHTSTNPTVSFQKITQHFLALFEACPSLRMKTEKELNTLKISDGDFDVRGLSVWGDILLALNK